ncbi:hypothetical protein RKD26_001326 [Streptomyces calvus]|uniref:hypothetical protein n=1 Tax=Streptomyces calvus TaxID=67282 RepID=UPI003513CF09
MTSRDRPVRTPAPPTVPGDVLAGAVAVGIPLRPGLPGPPASGAKVAVQPALTAAAGRSGAGPDRGPFAARPLDLPDHRRLRGPHHATAPPA